MGRHLSINFQPLDYELVKMYHPDVVSASLPGGSLPLGEQGASSPATPPEEHLSPEIAQSRFQAVTKAYGSLRKGKAKGKAHLGANPFADVAESRMSARRRRELRARAELRVGDDEKWRERLIVGALFAVNVIEIYLHVWNEVLNSFTDDVDFCVSNIRDAERRVGYCRRRKFAGEWKEENIRGDSYSTPPTKRPNREHQEQTNNRGREPTSRTRRHLTFGFEYTITFSVVSSGRKFLHITIHKSLNLSALISRQIHQRKVPAVRTPRSKSYTPHMITQPSSDFPSLRATSPAPMARRPDFLPPS